MKYQVKQNPRTFDVTEELNAQTVTEVSAFDQTRDVRNDERFIRAIN